MGALTTIRDIFEYFLSRLPYFNILLEERTALKATFVKRDYEWMLQRLRPNTTLLDFGTSIGDTAIYFALSDKTRNVYSYEADLIRYKRALSNIKTSGLSEKITVKHLAINSDNIKQILNDKKNIAIKCDIEGAERGIFTNLDLRNVYLMQIEYHHGMGKEIASELRRKGFDVRILKTAHTILQKEVGWLFCYK